MTPRKGKASTAAEKSRNYALTWKSGASAPRKVVKRSRRALALVLQEFAGHCIPPAPCPTRAVRRAKSIALQPLRDCIADNYDSAANGQTNSLPALAYLQHRQKRLLGNIHTADALHALLTFFLFFQQLALAGDVAAVAFGEHVLAHGMDRFAGDDLGADRSRSEERRVGKECRSRWSPY